MRSFCLVEQCKWHQENVLFTLRISQYVDHTFNLTKGEHSNLKIFLEIFCRKKWIF